MKRITTEEVEAAYMELPNSVPIRFDFVEEPGYDPLGVLAKVANPGDSVTNKFVWNWAVKIYDKSYVSGFVSAVRGWSPLHDINPYVLDWGRLQRGYEDGKNLVKYLDAI